MHQFVKDPRIIERLRRGELGDHIDSYAALLSQQNYAASSAYKQLLVISRFSQWLQRRGIEVHRVDEDTLQKFLRPIPRKMRFQSDDAAALNDQPAHTREAKLGCVFTQNKLMKKATLLGKRLRRRIWAPIESCEEFGCRLYAEAWRRGWARAHMAFNHLNLPF